MIKVKIDVTQKDIDGGVVMDCYRCPIALAANRVFKRVLVGSDELEIVGRMDSVTKYLYLWRL